MAYGADIRIRLSADQRAGLQRLANEAKRSLSDFCRVVLTRELELSPSAEAEPQENPREP